MTADGRILPSHPMEGLDLPERVRCLEERVAILEARSVSTERRTMGLEQFTAAIMQRPLPNLYHPMNTGGFSAPYQYPPHQHQQPAQQPQQPATLFSMVMIKEVAMIAMIGMLLGIGWVSRNPTDARDFSREFMGQTIRKITK